MTATMARSSAGAELRAALERELVSAVGAFNPFVARLDICCANSRGVWLPTRWASIRRLGVWHHSWFPLSKATNPACSKSRS